MSSHTDDIKMSDVLGVAKIIRGAKLEAPPGAQPEMERPPEAEPTAVIGPYQLIGRFPSSATSMVFLAYKSSPFGIIRRAVVKWVSSTEHNFEDTRHILIDEARAIAFLDHPNLVTVLDAGEDEAGVYISVEYVPGPDLRRVLKELRQRQSRMPVSLACFITIEVLRGLQHAHEAVGPDNAPLKLVHRDVNPSNVILSSNGGVKLTDFGMVHMVGRMQAPTAPRIVKGKYRYLAPEYISDQTISAQTDIYGAGIMLMEMLTGQPCFESERPAKTMTMIVKEGPPYQQLEQLGIPKNLINVVRAMTDRKPAARFPTARQACDALEGFLSESGVYVSPSLLARYLIDQRMPVR